jgi:hypothetical protein
MSGGRQIIQPHKLFIHLYMALICTQEPRVAQKKLNVDFSREFVRQSTELKYGRLKRKRESSKEGRERT